MPASARGEPPSRALMVKKGIIAGAMRAAQKLAAEEEEEEEEEEEAEAEAEAEAETPAPPPLPAPRPEETVICASAAKQSR